MINQKIEPQVHTHSIGHSGIHKKNQKTANWLIGLVIAIAVFVIGTTILMEMKVVANPFQQAVGHCGSSDQSNQGKPVSVYSNPVTETKTTFNVSQTISQVTLVVNRVSADSNRIAITMSVYAPDCSDYFPIKKTLTDAQGNNFPLMQGSTFAATKSGGGGDFIFDPSDITDNPSLLRLHLEIAGVLKTNSGSSGTGGQTVVSGPFTFDFSVPFNAAPVRTARLNQMDNTGGVLVTLEKVVVSQSQARFYLRGKLGTGIDYELIAGNIFITSDNRGDSILGRSSITSNSDDLTIISFDVNQMFYNVQGEWSLTIRPHKFPNNNSKNGISPTSIPGGPWVFRFSTLR